MFILLRDKTGLGAGAKSRKQKGRWETQGQKPRLVFYKSFPYTWMEGIAVTGAGPVGV